MLQDSLARKLDEPYISVYQNSNLNIYKSNHSTRISTIKGALEVLYDIHLSLSLKKIIGPFIKRIELKRIVETAEDKIKDVSVKQEIDKVFEEYLPTKKIIPFMPTKKDIWENNKPIMKKEVENKIEEAIKENELSLKEAQGRVQSSDKGTSMVKSTRYFKSGNNDLE